jgi:hypothetical protein
VAAEITLMPWLRKSAPGHLASRAGVISLLSTRGDGMLNGPQAARLAGMSESGFRNWRQRGWISPDGLDERGHPLYYPATVRTAVREVTQRGLQASRGKLDPRQIRQRAAA